MLVKGAGAPDTADRGGSGVAAEYRRYLELERVLRLRGNPRFLGDHFL